MRQKIDLSRRNFVRLAGVGIVGLAGCSGEGGDGTDGGSGGGNTDTDGGSDSGGETESSDGGSTDSGGPGGPANGQAGTHTAWDVDWYAPEPMLDRINGEEWIPPEFNSDQVNGDINYFNLGSMEFDPATAYGIEAVNERAGLSVEPTVVPSQRAVPKTTTALSARSETPTAFQVDRQYYMSLVQPGWLEPVDELWPDEVVNEFPAAWEEDFYTDVDATLDGEHIYGSHAVAEGFFLHHRADYLEQLGFPKDFLVEPTWEDLEEVCRETQSADVDFAPYVWQGAGPRSPPTWWIVKTRSQGRDIIQDNGRVLFNSEEGRRALRWQRQLVEEGLVPNPLEFSTGNGADLFLQGGLLAYELGGKLMASSLETYEPGSQYQLGLPPRATEGPDPYHASAILEDLICINRFAPEEKKRAAMVYLDAGRSAEFDREEWVQEGNMPANPAAFEQLEDAPFFDVLDQGLRNAKDEIWPSQIQTINALSEQLQQAWGGEKAPQAALEDAQAEVDAVLDQ